LGYIEIQFIRGVICLSNSNWSSSFKKVWSPSRTTRKLPPKPMN